MLLNIHWRGVYVKVWRDGSSIVTEILLIGVDARGRNFGLWYYSRFYREYLSQSITHLQIIIEGIAQSYLEVLFGPVEFNTFQVLVLIGISEPCGGPAQVVMFIIPSPLSIRLITCLKTQSCILRADGTVPFFLPPFSHSRSLAIELEHAARICPLSRFLYW